jgi:hypothetical protein
VTVRNADIVTAVTEKKHRVILWGAGSIGRELRTVQELSATVRVCPQTRRTEPAVCARSPSNGAARSGLRQIGGW